MTHSPTVSWSFEGEYFENCNCAVACPCLFSTQPSMVSMPTEGSCEITFAFHIDRGSYGVTSLDSLNVAMIARTPGPMIDGNWEVALYLDDRADERGQAALFEIFSGAAGGAMGAIAPLFGTLLGARTAPISYTIKGSGRSITIPGVMSVAVRPIASMIDEDTVITAFNAHPFASEGVVMAVGEKGNTWNDFGYHWDNSGKHGHYAPIRWSNTDRGSRLTKAS